MTNLIVFIYRYIKCGLCVNLVRSNAMVIEGVPNTSNNTGSDTVRSTYQALTTTQKKNLDATDNGADLSSSVVSVDIAENSHKLLFLEERLGAIKNPLDRGLAKVGLKNVIRYIVNEDPSAMDQFLSTLHESADVSDEALEKAFIEAGLQDGKEINLHDFLRSFIS